MYNCSKVLHLYKFRGVFILQIVDIKQKIEKLRAELEIIIEMGKGEGICIDNRIYELSINIDDLINIYIKEQQERQKM